MKDDDKKKIIPLWDNQAKRDLKSIYKFNKDNFSVEFAKKVRKEIYDIAGSWFYVKYNG